MNLIEQYIYAVTKHLPVAQREDVADELRSMIMDELEEKSSRSKKNIEAVLLKLGDPDTLARKYVGSKQYIIGPTLYPSYIRLLKYGFMIGLPIAFVLSLILNLSESPASLINLLVESVGNTVAAGIQIIFWISLTFFIIERSGVDTKEFAKSNGLWNPSMLPQLPTRRQIPISEVVADLFAYLFFIVVPIIAPRFIGTTVNGTFTPIFDPALWSIVTIPIILTGLVGLTLSLVKLFKRNWSRSLAIANLLFALTISALLIIAFLNVQIINPELLVVLQAHTESSTIAQLSAWASWTIGISIAVTIVIYLYEAIKRMILAFKPTRKTI